MSVFEWVVLIGASLWMLLTNITIRNHYKQSSIPMIPSNMIALCQTLSVVGVLVFRRSPLHLLWLFPLGLIAAFFALRLKSLGFIAWLYGYLVAYTILANW